jgi:hypothetical protein
LKARINKQVFNVLKTSIFYVVRAEGFSWSFEALHGGLGFGF